ncbi:DUF4331 domain-containing protein [Trinickia violacea]|uniref:DUF4331 domain-containing protein n=1 Tax=Trinickia violacea TaxID=2571746 RepID=A0A4P8J4A4_9BURK|nr:DUF4331 domain-containing protein [Trinickia violacea]QCP54844.1 DUF4331 domain-containing protein [Trinickia violacea]
MQVLTAAVLLYAAVGGAYASSHREAPLITTMPKVDGTDFYMFNSYEPNRRGYVTLIANYSPLEDAYGGPNYFALDPDALYEIHIDNVGDARAHLTFQFRFKNTVGNIALNVGGKQVPIPLVQAGPVSAGDSSKLNVNETYTLNVLRGTGHDHSGEAVTGPGGITTFTKPTDFIGTKTFGSASDYARYARQYIYTINIPGCGSPGRVFVGQRKESFAVALGKTFDLLNLNPLGPRNGNSNDLADKNITSIALEVPTACLMGGSGSPVIGGWTTSSVRQEKLLALNPGSANSTPEKSEGGWIQVSRLGMPLVNELVIGLKDKDKFNNSTPANDAQFAEYVTNPTLPALIESLFPAAKAPTNFPRVDLVFTFLTGFQGLNQLSTVTASEMLRLNTSIPPTPKGSQRNLGVLVGDNAGFPNGRRPGDDVVTASLRVVIGVLCTFNNPKIFGCSPADAPAGAAPLTDGAAIDDSVFDNSFPYLTTPIPGATN